MEDLERVLLETDQRSKGNSRRIETLEKKVSDQDKLISTINVLATEQEHIKTDVAEIKSGVKSLTDKPAKMWDGIVQNVVFGVIGFFLAWLFQNVH